MKKLNWIEKFRLKTLFGGLGAAVMLCGCEGMMESGNNSGVSSGDLLFLSGLFGANAFTAGNASAAAGWGLASDLAKTGAIIEGQKEAARETGEKIASGMQNEKYSQYNNADHDQESKNEKYVMRQEIFLNVDGRIVKFVDIHVGRWSSDYTQFTPKYIFEKGEKVGFLYCNHFPSSYNLRVKFKKYGGSEIENGDVIPIPEASDKKPRYKAISLNDLDLPTGKFKVCFYKDNEFLDDSIKIFVMGPIEGFVPEIDESVNEKKDKDGMKKKEIPGREI